MNLTESQRRASSSRSPRIAVIAGPGSGKTAVLVRRIVGLRDAGARPARMIVLTFTNAAAKELSGRLGMDGVTGIGFTGTLHAFALRCLRIHGAGMGYGDRIGVLSEDSMKILLESKARQLARGKVTIKQLIELKGRGRAAFSDKFDLPQLVLKAYLAEIREAGLVDFDVILSEFLRALTMDMTFAAAIAAEFDHLFDDEAQDHAPVDWGILRALPIPNKFIVGDPDQSIYRFRGADVAELIKFAREPDVECILLEENFRSVAHVCQAAQTLIENNKNRVAKRTRSVRGPSNEPPAGAIDSIGAAPNPGAEVATISEMIDRLSPDYLPQDFAVLTRSNFLAGEILKGLDAAGIQVAKRDLAALPEDFPMARILIEYLANPENDTLGLLFLRARLTNVGQDNRKANINAHEARRAAQVKGHSINDHFFGFPRNLPAGQACEFLEKQGVSRESRMIVAERLAGLNDGAFMVELAFSLMMQDADAREKSAAQVGVNVMTMHAAKGREFGVVFVAALEDEVIPGRRADCDIEEERRLLYVAMTRAKDRLFFSHARYRVTKWKAIERHSPSPFIAEIDDVPL